MSPDDMEALVRKLHGIWNTGDISQVGAVYSEDFIVHWLSAVPPYKAHGRKGVERAITETKIGFSDWHEEIVDLLIDKDRVVTRYISSGTHSGEYSGIKPTGKKILLNEISIFCVKQDLISEQWCVDNIMSLMAQLNGQID